MTMIELLKWLSHGSVYVNVFRKSNNSDNNSSHGIPPQKFAVPWLGRSDSLGNESFDTCDDEQGIHHTFSTLYICVGCFHFTLPSTF